MRRYKKTHTKPLILQLMLQRLSIQNYAIIESLSIECSSGLNVITGETGAGKSIIVGALGLILGERADSTALLNKDSKCIVEGVFSQYVTETVNQFLDENEFDKSDELVIRREIAKNGKSRAFINDTPATLAQLQSLSRMLVDLHQQFDSLELSETDFQRQVLDALSGQAIDVNRYSEIFRQWQIIKKETEDLKARQQQFEKETDYNRFQFNELNEAAFRENELEEIDTELKLLSNAEEIKSGLTRVYFDLNECENPLVQQLKALLNQLQHYSAYHPDLPVLTKRLASVQIELQDIASETDRLSNKINNDPAKMNELNERLSLGYKLQKKHGVNSTNALLEVQGQLEEKLKAVLQIGDLISEKEKESKLLFSKIESLSAKISENRRKQVKPLEDAVNGLLKKVGMPNAKLKVEIKNVEPGLYGADAIDFLFNANSPTEAKTPVSFMPIRKVASGGELSRLMLCIKSLVAESVDLPTLIFDEIDSGISGEAARQVGIIMKELAAKRQVICITHQPQIAGKADIHFFVYKEIIKDQVKTNIRQLSVEERITAIAKMLSGEKPTAAAMENAREMVRN